MDEKKRRAGWLGIDAEQWVIAAIGAIWGACVLRLIQIAFGA